MAAQISKAQSLDLAREHPALELDINDLQFNSMWTLPVAYPTLRQRRKKKKKRKRMPGQMHQKTKTKQKRDNQIMNDRTGFSHATFKVWQDTSQTFLVPATFTVTESIKKVWKES